MRQKSLSGFQGPDEMRVSLNGNRQYVRDLKGNKKRDFRVEY